MGNRLLFFALLITLLLAGGLFIIMARLARRTPRPEPDELPRPEPKTPQATILRVASTEKIDRHELKINLLLEVNLPNAAAYESQAAWIIRVGRIVGMQPGRSFPVKIGEDDAVIPLMDWAKLWHEGYIPPPRD